MKILIIFVLISNLFFLSADTVEQSDSNSSTEMVDDGFMDGAFDDEFSDASGMAEIFDPLSGYNRIMTNFNDQFYVHLLTPVAKGYQYIIPQKGRIGVSNFFDNLLFPVRLVNNLLQLKFKNSGDEILRFSINSTVGVLGFFDPAKEYFEIEEHKEDFGQTLGVYGVGSGFHVVLPFLGPSNLRDMSGLFVDAVADPLYQHDQRFYNITRNNYETFVAKSYDILNDGSLHIGEYESLKKDALILYPFLRDLYESRREKLIKE